MSCTLQNCTFQYTRLMKLHGTVIISHLCPLYKTGTCKRTLTYPKIVSPTYGPNEKSVSNPSSTGTKASSPPLKSATIRPRAKCKTLIPGIFVLNINPGSITIHTTRFKYPGISQYTKKHAMCNLCARTEDRRIFIQLARK